MGSALWDAIVLPAACVLFLGMEGMSLARAWWRGGAVWKGRMSHTAQRLPPWARGQA